MKPVLIEITPTTVKIPSDLNVRLSRVASANELSKSAVFRLSMEAGLAKVESGLRAMRTASPAIVMDSEQLEEAKEIYKSGVTDLVTGVAELHGKEFVAAVEQKLPGLKLKAKDLARVRRFLGIYAQLEVTP